MLSERISLNRTQRDPFNSNTFYKTDFLVITLEAKRGVTPITSKVYVKDWFTKRLRYYQNTAFVSDKLIAGLANETNFTC